MQVFNCRAEILFCLVHDGLSLARADFRFIGQHHDACEMERTRPRSGQGRDELRPFEKHIVLVLYSDLTANQQTE